MNDEIKEILGILRRCTYGNEVYLIKEHGATLLLDYITNLQHTEDLYNQLLKDYEELEQSYQELKDSKQWWNNRFNAVQRDYEELKQKLEKANEFINENTELEHDGDDYGYMEWINIINMDTMTFINNLSDILNGRSDE